LAIYRIKTAAYKAGNPIPSDEEAAHIAQSNGIAAVVPLEEEEEEEEEEVEPEAEAVEEETESDSSPEPTRAPSPPKSNKRRKTGDKPISTPAKETPKSATTVAAKSSSEKERKSKKSKKETTPPPAPKGADKKKKMSKHGFQGFVLSLILSSSLPGYFFSCRLLGFAVWFQFFALPRCLFSRSELGTRSKATDGCSALVLVMVY
jgi:hypothetical protein